MNIEELKRKYNNKHIILEKEEADELFSDKDKLMDKYVELIFNDENNFLVFMNMDLNDSNVKIIVNDTKIKIKNIKACKTEIIKYAYDNMGKLNLNDDFKEKIINLYKHYQYDFNENLINEYKVTVNGEVYSINTSKFKELIDILSEVNLNSRDDLGNSNNHFQLFTFMNFYENYLKHNYIMNNQFETNIQFIKENYDFDSFNIKNFGESIHLIKDVEIDQDYKNEIMSKVPTELKPFEKALYIYLLLCKDLSYDEVVYASGEVGERVDLHKDFNYIRNINKDNPMVVCFSFTALYSAFLKDLGIKQELISRDSLGYELKAKEYGEGHQLIKILHHPYVLSLDATVGVIETDLFNVKMKNPLVGVKIQSTNKETIRSFNEKFELINQLFINNEMQDDNEFINQEVYDALLLRLKLLSDNHPLSIDDKLVLMEEFVKNVKLNGMDIYSIFVNLRRMIFNKDDRDEKVALEIVTDNRNKTPKPIIVITKNYINYLTRSSENKYYLYEPKKEIQEIPRDEMNSLYRNGLIRAVKRETFIPGITTDSDGKILKL